MKGLWVWDLKTPKLKPIYQEITGDRVVNGFHTDPYGNIWMGFKGEILKISRNGQYEWIRRRSP